MTYPASSDPEKSGPVSFAVEGASDAEDHEAWENEGGPAEGATAPVELDPRHAATAAAREIAVNELVFALYAEDVRMGIVREADILDVGGALSLIGGSNYHRRAAAILSSLSRVSDAQIRDACAAEGADTPRGAAARAQLRLRDLTRT